VSAIFGLRNGVFGNERPVEALRVAAQDGLEGAADGHFVVNVKLAVLVEDGVVVLDDLVGGLDVELGHGLLNPG